jgi:hypothetical protein
MNIYVDCETIGLNGPVKLIQYSVNREPVGFIKLPAGPVDQPTWEDLLDLFSLLNDADNVFVGWNTSFDLFHLYRLRQKITGETSPFKCQVLDLYFHACFSGPFAAWAFTGKKVGAIRRIPRVALTKVAEAVEARLKPLVPGALNRHEHEVPERPDLVTLSWTVSMSLGLKTHAEYWGEPVLKLADVWPLPPKDTERLWVTSYEDETGSLISPYRELVERCDLVLADENGPFYTYARKDIEYLWLAEDKLGKPKPAHHDTAAHVVAYTRYTGIPLDADTRRRTESFYRAELQRITDLLAGTNLKSSVERRKLMQSFDPLIQSTRKSVLEYLIKDPSHPACETAKAMLQFGSAKQKLDQVIKAGESPDGHLHADLKVLGTATGRMSGTGGFNVQGIGKAENGLGLRSAILVEAVGDFHQYEIAIAATAWNDKQLQDDLANGIDVHLMVAITCHPRLVDLNIPYSEAKAARKDKTHKYHGLIVAARDQCKRVVFGIIYGCTENKVADVLSTDVETARGVLQRMQTRYPGLFAHRTEVQQKFCTADTQTWFRGSVAKMEDSITDLTGFTRRWSFEKQVAKVLWELGNEGIRTGLIGSIVRQKIKGPQEIDQAVRSALLGASIAIQQAVFRQAANGEIQMPGANLCKMLQAAIWNKFHCPCLNSHDELVFPKHPNFDYDAVSAFILAWVDEHKRLVKDLRFDLAKTERWSDKG